ncbi:metallophosphoesterase [Candidatus Pacearchaeota archaeon]|nr:metallophosphoesterase [Candidatus Pacearchaeota archaeon]
MPLLRLIGDVHGEYEQYLKLTQDAEYSIQLGDMGFNYSPLKVLDSTRHKFLPGNHDNYRNLPNDYVLGDFGLWKIPNTDSELFFVRGAYSVDKIYRIEGTSWWPEEELTQQQATEAIDLYEQTKPDVVISHACPYVVMESVPSFLGSGWGGSGIISNSTQHMLSVMWNIHRPKLWVFAHYHKSLDLWVEPTYFRCLDTLTYEDFDLAQILP